MLSIWTTLKFDTLVKGFDSLQRVSAAKLCFIAYLVKFLGQVGTQLYQSDLKVSFVFFKRSFMIVNNLSKFEVKLVSCEKCYKMSLFFTVMQSEMVNAENDRTVTINRNSRA